MSASSLSKEKKLLNIDWKWMSSCLCALAFGWSDVRASFFYEWFLQGILQYKPCCLLIGPE